MSSRRLSNLIKRLPSDSETSKAIHGRDAEWTRLEHLVAEVADRVALLWYAFACVHAAEGAHIDPPEPIYRPGVEPPPAPEAPDIASFFAM